jgi:hypothetical protein
MVETNRMGSSQMDPGSYGTAAPSRADYLSRDSGTPVEESRTDYDERYGRQAGRLLREDSIIVLGVLLGGAAGYMAATAVSRSDRTRNSKRRFASGGIDRYSGSGGQAVLSRSVEREETTDLIASSKVEGTPVYNHQGEHLGEVYNFMVGKRSGHVAYAVMSFGGFLGIGQKYHGLPWSVLTYDTGKKGYVIDADKDRLMGAPSYPAGEEPFSQPDYAQQVREYWSLDLP